MTRTRHPGNLSHGAATIQGPAPAVLTEPSPNPAPILIRLGNTDGPGQPTVRADHQRPPWSQNHF
ncbi:MAG: hypothetical protein KIT69_15860 [Propionibacteriaceae bacterium]|nr:hypothetical protein [Propionibacteriaceae bacterium]